MLRNKKARISPGKDTMMCPYETYWLKVSICIHDMALELLILDIIGARHFMEGVFKGDYCLALL
jgi:hypothetical protein